MLTIWHDGSQHTFTAGHDVVIGRDEDADIRIVDPRISREHLIYRRPVIDIRDGKASTSATLAGRS